MAETEAQRIEREKAEAREVVQDMVKEGQEEARRAKKKKGIRASRGVPKRQPQKRRKFTGR